MVSLYFLEKLKIMLRVLLIARLIAWRRVVGLLVFHQCPLCILLSICIGFSVRSWFFLFFLPFKILSENKNNNNNNSCIEELNIFKIVSKICFLNLNFTIY